MTTGPDDFPAQQPAPQPTPQPSPPPQEIGMTLGDVRALANAIRGEVAKAIVGQDAMIDQLLVALISQGHVLLEGPPGTAKTFLANAFSTALGMDFGRIQFTPDLLPGDILGSNLFNFQTSQFTLTRGPIFCDLLLADEINRTPPKTQAALLEAMQEHRVTIQGRTYDLAEPFFVFATQNPIELEGTYPLPEAQLDRFMFHIIIEHPPEDEEYDVVRTTTAILDPKFNRPVSGEQLVAFQKLVRRVPVSEPVMRYALRLVRTSRPKSAEAPESVKKYAAFGASVRAAQFLILGAKARALTSGRYHVSFDDIKALAHPVLRHRVLTNFRAESEGITSDVLIDDLLKVMPLPKSGM